MARHAFGNLGRHAPQRVVWAAIWTIWTLATSRGIIGFAEIGEGDTVNEKHRIWKQWGKLWQRDRAGWATKTPIVFGPMWRKAEKHVTHLSPGVKGVSPPRKLVEVLLVRRVTGERVVRLNGHWIAGAWNGKRQRAQQLREQYWREAFETTRERVHYWHDRGFDVVISGDFNRQQPPVFHRKQVVGVEHSTDAIIAVPGPGREAVTKNPKVKRLGIDFHRGLAVNITFKEAR